ncbi:hypothetical Protein YC6258_03541 [Gynuella sunshinyii YC6258]|uniref:Uncharacterized protein n=1 Tax=Gynuella sunshinyii YC6258 TaxID=1445510 RepID=A0A0C5VLI6_9GAMM|nr:hypothetical Protein YC6258_03541 [Gynuella sunshinyii YC6258]
MWVSVPGVGGLALVSGILIRKQDKYAPDLNLFCRRFVGATER